MGNPSALLGEIRAALVPLEAGVQQRVSFGDNVKGGKVRKL